MSRLRVMISQPGRAVAVLAFTQILTWGILIYPPVLTMRHIAEAHGWSTAFCMAGFSLGLVVSGICSPFVGALIDRLGGRRVMGAGALAGAAGLTMVAFADHRVTYLASWVLLGGAMASSLYDPAFATLTRIFGTAARRQITLVTFAGGFASTVGWPATHLLLQSVGWQGTYLVFAGVFVLVIAPLHAFGLPDTVAATVAAPVTGEVVEAPQYQLPQGLPFILLAAAFALYSLVLSGVTSNLLALLERGGLSAATVVMIGSLFGPAQVAARFIDFMFARKTNPLWIARIAVVTVLLAFAMLIFIGVSVQTALIFSVAFGAANGVITIARGALPLQMFGPIGYGKVMGRIARPALFVQASAPFIVSWSLERFSDEVVLCAALIAISLVMLCFSAMRAPAAPR